MRTSELTNAFQCALKKIESAKISTKPFPHLVVDNVFPTEFYKKFHRTLHCEGTRWKYQAGARWPYVVLGSKGIEDVRLTAGATNSLRHTGSKLVEEFESFVRSKDFAGTLLSKFSQGSNDQTSVKAISDFKLQQLQESSGWCNYVVGSEFVKDLPGFEYPPHADKADKVVTFLFYMTNDSTLSQEGCGTYLCTPTDEIRMKLRPGYFDSGFFSWVNFHATEIAMVPNRFVAFAPTESSFHAVKVGSAGRREKVLTLEDVPDRLLLRGFIRIDKFQADSKAYSAALKQAPLLCGLTRTMAILTALATVKRSARFTSLRKRAAFHNFIFHRVLYSNSHLVGPDGHKPKMRAARLWLKSWKLAQALASEGDQDQTP